MKKFVVKVEQTRSSSFIIEAEDEEAAQEIIDFMDDDDLEEKVFGRDGKEKPEFINLDAMIVEERD